MSLPAVLDPVEPIPLPDVRRLEQMPSLPAWAASRAALVKVETQRDQATSQWRKVPTLPAGSMLKAAEREVLERHVAELRALGARTPANDAEAEQETLRAITKMMLVYPSAIQNELSAEARGEAFMDAVEDLPPWAVHAAIRRWRRGDAGKRENGQPYDYHWAPAPAELRRVAWLQMHRINGRAETIETLLRAEPLIEFSDEHCTSMRVRIKEMFRNLSTPLVGKDGSGGAAGQSPADGANCGTQAEVQTRP